MVVVRVYEVETGASETLRVPALPPVGGRLSWLGTPYQTPAGEGGKERAGRVVDVVVHGVVTGENGDDEVPRPPTVMVRDVRVTPRGGR